jgi:hypothetical protein
VTLTVHDATLELPLHTGPRRSPAAFRPGAAHTAEDPSGVTWTLTDDVLARTTAATVGSTSSYAVPFDGQATETYAGTVAVDRRTFDQTASAHCAYDLSWPGVSVRLEATMEVAVTAAGYAVRIDTRASEGGAEVAAHSWEESFPR